MTSFQFPRCAFTKQCDLLVGVAIALTLTLTGADKSHADELNRLGTNKLVEMTALVRHSKACPEVPRPWAAAYVMLLMMAPPMEEQVEAQERKMLALRDKIGSARWCQLLIHRDGGSLPNLPAGDVPLRCNHASAVHRIIVCVPKT